MKNSPLQSQLLSALPPLGGNSRIVYQMEDLSLHSISNGILIILAAWSVQSIAQSTQTIKRLYNEDFSGEIIILDNDCIDPDVQIRLLGEVTHGRGESFVIKDGKVIRRFK